MSGMDILDGEGFRGRFMPSLNNTTYSGLFYKFNEFILVLFHEELVEIRVEGRLLSGFGELETVLSHF